MKKTLVTMLALILVGCGSTQYQSRPSHAMIQSERELALMEAEAMRICENIKYKAERGEWQASLRNELLEAKQTCIQYGIYIPAQ